MTIYTFDKEKISDLREELCLTIDWKKNTEHLKNLLDRYTPFAEVAACWSQPGEYNFFTSDAEKFFLSYFKDIKRADMIQSKDLILLENKDIANTYVISINLDETYLGMLLVHITENIEIEILKLLVKAILPQLSLARYATAMAAEVEKRTSTDKLTGLWNRTYFNERFREECIRLQRTKEQGTVVVVALDELAAMEKVISKEEHEKLIIEASQLIRKMLRKTDWIVYWDKHEILVYLTNSQPESSIDVMTRCVGQLVNTHPLLSPLMGLCSTSETTSARALIQLAARRLDLARKDHRKMLVCYATKDGLKFIQLTPKNIEKKEEAKN
ncbi:MAG: diguanylate cyclase [Candidatus Sericytochromatia bacterium]